MDLLLEACLFFLKFSSAGLLKELFSHSSGARETSDVTVHHEYLLRVFKVLLKLFLPTSLLICRKDLGVLNLKHEIFEVFQ
jgi:hypothetical protein